MTPRRWLRLGVRLGRASPSPEEPARAAGDGIVESPEERIPQELCALGARAVEEVGSGSWRTYFVPPQDPARFRARVEEALRAAAGAADLTFEWDWQDHEDWQVLWRRGLKARRVTSRLVVAPSWESVSPRRGERVLRLDPGVAFGTAEHPTTRGCLRLLDPRITSAMAVADVGAGSAILSIAAALLGASRVLALEADELACEAARENVVRNGVAGVVEVRHFTVEPGGLLPGAPYDGVVANLQTGLLLPLLGSLAESLTRGGFLVLGGVLQEESSQLLSAAPGSGLTLEGEDLEEGWWSAAFRRG